MDQDIDDSLWKAARGLEEKMMLVKRACANGVMAQGDAELERLGVRLETLQALLIMAPLKPSSN